MRFRRGIFSQATRRAISKAAMMVTASSRTPPAPALSSTSLFPRASPKELGLDTISQDGRTCRLLVHPEQVLEIAGPNLSRILLDTLRVAIDNVPADVEPMTHYPDD